MGSARIWRRITIDDELYIFPLLDTHDMFLFLNIQPQFYVELGQDPQKWNFNILHFHTKVRHILVFESDQSKATDLETSFRIRCFD